jgi:hypothetical protein
VDKKTSNEERHFRQRAKRVSIELGGIADPAAGSLQTARRAIINGLDPPAISS